MATTSRSPTTVLGALLAFVLALSGALLGTAPRAAAAPDPTGTPFGQVDSAVVVPTGIELSGWAIDPDTTDPIYVWVTIDGVGRHVYANKPRPDVGAAYPGSGANHGFNVVLTAAIGTHQVCVAASNVGPGVHKNLGCRTASIRPVGEPFGNIETARGVFGGVEIKGWAIDPDTTAPLYVWVTIDGVGRHLYADKTRPDVGAAYPASGANHGFAATLRASGGTHQVCVTASNVGPGTHKNLGCRTVNVSGTPTGNFESATGVLGGIEIKGWAIDPDSTGPIYLWVTVDGVGRHLHANRSRPDVGAAYPDYGPGHGFTAMLNAPAGSHTVCVTASNAGPGAHRSLGCRTATAQGNAVLRGAVCYPSDFGLPPMDAYFRDTTTGQTWTLPIAKNQFTYEVGLPAGTYIAFVYVRETPSLGGAYTAFIPCGANAECTDHTLLPVTVLPGQSVGGVDLCDWYGGPGPWLPPNPRG